LTGQRWIPSFSSNPWVSGVRALAKSGKTFKFFISHSFFLILNPYLCRPKNSVLNCIIMARVCQVTGKVPVGGHKVSHSNIKTRRRFLPNLQKKRFYLAEEDKWITLKLTTDAMRTINKRGLFTVVKELRSRGEKI
jgi:large subunit ribosomal protein L28